MCTMRHWNCWIFRILALMTIISRRLVATHMYYGTSTRAMCVWKCVRKRFWKCACVVGACRLICELRCAIALFTLVDMWADEYRITEYVNKYQFNKSYLFPYSVIRYSSAPISTRVKIFDHSKCNQEVLFREHLNYFWRSQAFPFIL